MFDTGTCRSREPGGLPMLLSSILSILDKHDLQPQSVTAPDVSEPFRIESCQYAEKMQEPRKVQTEIATAAGMLRPLIPSPGVPSTNIGELIRAVAKFEQKENERMIDVFE
jgi:hypothetical protein